jgi:hypothetical protein
VLRVCGLGFSLWGLGFRLHLPDRVDADAGVCLPLPPPSDSLPLPLQSVSGGGKGSICADAVLPCRPLQWGVEAGLF